MMHWRLSTRPPMPSSRPCSSGMRATRTDLGTRLDGARLSQIASTRLAAREGMSVSAVALRVLAEASRRGDNPRLLAALPDHGNGPSDIVDGPDADRAVR
jgi:hypothetical protein